MVMSLLLYEPEKELEVYEELSSLPDFSISSNGFAWIDIESTDSKELQEVAAHFDFHELTVEDCLTPGHFPKLDDYGAYLFMLFRALKPSNELETIWEDEEEGDSSAGEDEAHLYYTQKIAIYLSHNFVVTFRRSETPWIDAMIRQIKQYPNLLNDGTDVVAYRVIDVLTDRFMRGMGFFDKIIDDFEETALKNPDSFDVVDLLEIKHILSSMRQMMRSQRGVTSRLANETELIQEKQRRRYFKDIDDHAVTILSQIEKQIDSILSLRDSYLAMANVRLGDTMRILTVLTTIVAPLNIVVGLYGMNFEAIPLLHNPHGFWMIVIGMAVLAILMLVYFRRRRWI